MVDISVNNNAQKSSATLVDNPNDVKDLENQTYYYHPEEYQQSTTNNDSKKNHQDNDDQKKKKNKKKNNDDDFDDSDDDDDKKTVYSQVVSSDDDNVPSSYTFTTEKKKIKTSDGSDSDTDDSDDIEGYTSKMAWVVVICVILLNTAVNITWLSPSSAPKVTSTWMNVSFSDLNWLSNASSIINAIVALPTAWSYERFGIKNNLLVAGFVNMFGCWIRYCSAFVPVHSRFWIVLIGQCIASISGSLTTNISTKLAAVWFAPKHRGIANTLTALSFAPAIAPIVIPLITPDPDSTPHMFLITAIFSSVVAILFPFLPQKPKTPPSYSATLSRTSVWKGMKLLIKNKDFLWLLIISSTGIGMALCFSVVIMEAIIPYGYTEKQAGICVAVMTISGFFGGGVTGYWLGKSNDPNTIIKTFTPLTIFSYIMFIYQIIPDAFNVVLIACIANGFFSYGLFTVYLELASEVTYPIPESVSSCCIAAGNSITIFIFTVILDAFRAGPDAHPPHHMHYSLIAAAVIVFIGSLPCLVLKGELKRLAVDQQLKSIQ